MDGWYEASNLVSDTARMSNTTAGTAPLRQGPARVQDHRNAPVLDSRATADTPAPSSICRATLLC